MKAHIHSLHIYPIKSCQGISLQTVELTATGFKYDRHWMLVDKQGKFISQRTHPQLATIKTFLTTDCLTVESHTSMLQIPLETSDNRQMQVTIWNDKCSAAIVSSECSDWFSQFLDTECELVFLPKSEKRQVDPEYSTKNQIVGFSDGFPLLVLSRASIDLLNTKLSQKADIDRFRANIILKGCPAHAEDNCSELSVNDITILLPKPCSRCIIPSIHQQNAEKYPEVLKALAGYRKTGNHIYFGQNGVHLSEGIISIGEEIELTEKPK